MYDAAIEKYRKFKYKILINLKLEFKHSRSHLRPMAKVQNLFQLSNIE